MGFVFLSYKREDIRKVRVVEEALRDAGITVWMDEEIQTGSVWREEIERKLREAACVVACVSRDSVLSEFVRDEMRWAWMRGKLFAVRLDEAELPLGFGEVQAFSLVPWPADERAMGRLTAAVRRRLEPRAKVLIASTVFDLEVYRNHAQRAAQNLDLATEFLADGVAMDGVDLVVAIVAHRWSRAVRNACNSGKPVIAFVVDDGFEWPEKWREKYRTGEVLNLPDPLPLITEIQQEMASLAEFKTELICGRRRHLR